MDRVMDHGDVTVENRSSYFQVFMNHTMPFEMIGALDQTIAMDAGDGCSMFISRKAVDHGHRIDIRRKGMLQREEFFLVFFP